jgi:hypothetical protein
MLSGMPFASVSTLRLTPDFALSVGFSPVFFPAERSFGHCAVNTLPFPIDAAHLVILDKSFSPKLQEYASFCPFLKPAMRGGRAANLCLAQRIPLASSACNKKDRIHCVSVWNPTPMASERVFVLDLWNQGLHLFPEFI